MYTAIEHSIGKKTRLTFVLSQMALKDQFYFPTGGEITRARRAMLKWQQCCFVNVKSRSTYLCHRERFVCINNSVGSRINPEKISKPQFSMPLFFAKKGRDTSPPPSRFRLRPILTFTNEFTQHKTGIYYELFELWHCTIHSFSYKSSERNPTKRNIWKYKICWNLRKPIGLIFVEKKFIFFAN